jgi:hypothetical protein
VPTSSGTSGFCGNASSKPDSVISNAKRTSQPAASGTGPSNSTTRNRDMNCHTCGGKGHFRRECPNKKVMLINEELKSMREVMMLIQIQMRRMMICSMVMRHHCLPLFVCLRC